MSNYKEQSRLDFSRPEGVNLTYDEVKIGCLQRIADATEAMAKEHNRLLAQLEYYKGYSSELQDKLKYTQRQLSSARGQLTRMKNKFKDVVQL